MSPKVDKTMRISVIIQARMSSSRLPGKVLMPIGERPALEHTIMRCRIVPEIDDLVLAISESDSDAILQERAKEWQIPVFRGPEEDVLARYHQVACELNSGLVVRITGDCPWIDPSVISQVIRKLRDHLDVDRKDALVYCSNTVQRSYPRGLDVEAFTFSALDYTNENAKLPQEREHVTLHMYSNPGIFRILQVVNIKDLSHLRWTLDTEEDYAFFQAACKHLPCEPPAPKTSDIIRTLDIYPDLLSINSKVVQKIPFNRSMPSTHE